jgi:DNA-binding transcriptional LysR family regulator
VITVLDPVPLRTFVTVARALSFSRAAEQLGLGQSTVSQHVRRLERTVGRQLLARDTHGVELTGDGQAMVGLAQEILDSHERALGYFAGGELRGRLRFGAGEDFALTRLAEVLRDFQRTHPRVDLELSIDLSAIMHRQLAHRRLDLVLAKRLPADPQGGGSGGGELVWRDRLRWVGADATQLVPGQPVPLVVYPPPSLTRTRALSILDDHGVPHRIACTSSSLSGIRAAVLAGLGVTVHASTLLPPGMRPLPAPGLPDPGEVEFVLTAARDPMPPVAAALAAAIQANAHRLRQSL